MWLRNRLSLAARDFIHVEVGAGGSPAVLRTDEFDAPRVAERGVGQTHPIAPVAVALVEPGTPAELQRMAERMSIHADAVVDDAHAHIGRIAFAAFLDSDFDAGGFGLESVVHQLS